MNFHKLNFLKILNLIFKNNLIDLFLKINLNIPSLFKFELLLQLFENCGNFIVFLLYLNKKLPQFLNYCRNFLIENSHLHKLGILLN